MQTKPNPKFHVLEWFPSQINPQKLVNQFKPSPPVSNDNDNEATMTESNKTPNIWLQLPYLGKFGERLTRSLIRKITPLLILTDADSLLTGKPLTATYLCHAKIKPRKLNYQSSVVYEFTCPGCNSRYIGKTDRCLYTRTKEHSYHTESVIHQHLSTCEQFQHIKALLELYPDDEAKSDQTSIMAEHVFNNTKIIDKSNHWSLLLYQESLAIQRYKYKPELNHGLKASKELIRHI